MTCASCEQRREWVKKQYERSKERMRLCIERLSNAVDPKQPAAIQSSIVVPAVSFEENTKRK